MLIEDIHVGETYRLTFTPQVSKVTIFGYPKSKSALMTPEFHNKYKESEWGAHQDKKVIVLGKTELFPPGIRFHFESDPEDFNITIYPDYFKPDTTKSVEKYLSPFSGKIV